MRTTDKVVFAVLWPVVWCAVVVIVVIMWIGVWSWWFLGMTTANKTADKK